MKKKILAIDVGGINIKAGIATEQGKVDEFAEIQTPKSDGPQGVFASILTILGIFNISPNKLNAISIGLPGPVGKDGIIYNPPNLQSWGVVDIPLDLAQFLNYPQENIYVANDASLAALAEYKFGNGRGANPMIMLTLGTGIGGGIIIDGKPFTGKNGFAPELGHIVLDPNGPRCGCGRLGCAETFVSHKGIVRTAWELLKRDKGSIMWSLMKESSNRIIPEVVKDAALLGDPAANKVIELTAQKLGILLADLINIFNPERIVIGGGITMLGKLLIEPAREYAIKKSLKRLSRDVTIVKAKFSQKAGVLGAASMALEKIHNRL